MDWNILIPLFGIAGGLAIPLSAIWLRHRQKIAEIQAGAMAEASAGKSTRYARHMRELEERVRVLERIVTDRGYDVGTQIEALRNRRRVEGPAKNRENA